MRKWLLGAPAAALAAVAAADLRQTRYPILRTFPVLGHARMALTAIGPELRQYIVASNDEERPFTRDQRDWIYESAEGRATTFSFGTDNDVEFLQGYPVVKQHTFTGVSVSANAHSGEQLPLPPAKVLGAARGRARAFRPESLVAISGMSYGALSGPAVEALNRGAALAGALHNTGEGGLSSHHQKGSDLIFQIGTAYFGVRDAQGRFDIDKLVALTENHPIRAIEIKLSQGAKPGLGGLLPGAKVTEEIAQIRGIPAGRDCASPSRHTAFGDVDSMLDLVEEIADRTGLPVGIKSAVGEMGFWEDLAAAMVPRERGVDFITIDGGEGGTGAAPLVFTDAVSLPFRLGFPRVYRVFAEAGLTDDVVFIGSGKLGIPENAVVAFALGVDMISVAREAMLSIGCIQAQKCHTDRCPTGVATQNPWLIRGVDPTDKAARCHGYLRSLKRELIKVSGAVGVPHPSLIGPQDVELVTGTRESATLAEVYGYHHDWGLPGEADVRRITEIMVAAGLAEHTAASMPPGV
ncbi:FMN-binding glutamate synthase family protein [Dietzia sp. PP-33]|jgi:glutamate synthase domain-containing protein 2|uniref:FMN-binding glutamate synthase family protein n=1 Tax=Dietzia sp. PP-33 TaxID=2957500 RepID=UPI0029B733BF|nr:FMN-binding glutamate synthase family protein [Dietzia sp. PP-33]MDX2357891.1 FMN-binding glutamate synthase family protein [Dietzia sp. PP-33]